MVKFWPETADIEPTVRAQKNFQGMGFSRAPCSERIVSKPLSEISENIQVSPSPLGNYGMINENVSVSFSGVNQPNSELRNSEANSVISGNTVGIVQTAERSLIDEIQMFSPSPDMLENIPPFTVSSIFEHVNIDLFSPVTSPAGPLTAL
jgi:hypothetical protein